MKDRIKIMIFTEKDIRDLKKAKIALNKLGKSSVLEGMIEVIEDMIIELEEYR